MDTVTYRQQSDELTERLVRLETRASLRKCTPAPALDALAVKVEALPRPKRFAGLRWDDSHTREGGRIVWVSFRGRYLPSTHHAYTHGGLGYRGVGEFGSIGNSGSLDGAELRYLAAISDLFVAASPLTLGEARG